MSTYFELAATTTDQRDIRFGRQNGDRMDYRTSRKAVQREVAASSKEVTLNLLLVPSHFFFVV
jgi:hypothetical protein